MAVDRVSIHEVKPGMVLATKIECPETKQVLVREGVKLTETMIRSLMRRRISHLSVNDRYTLLVDPLDSLKQHLKRVLEDQLQLCAPSEPEANLSDLTWEMGSRIPPILDKLLDNSQVMSLMLELRIVSSDDFFNHSLQTGLLAMLVGGVLNLSDDELYYLGMAGFLHDIGLRETPFLIGKNNLTLIERFQYQEHTRYGYYILKELGMPMEAAKAILHHHEFWDGGGYPDGKKGEEIPLLSRILGVVEGYDTLITIDGQLPHTAVEYLYAAGNFHFDSNVVNAFTSNISIYPMGSLVRLSTGEVGVVVNVRKNQGPRPVVRVHYNRVNRPLTNSRQVDLGEETTVFIAKIL